MDQIDSQRERAQFEAVWKRVTESSENPYAIAGELHGPEPKQTQRAENYTATNHSDNRDETEYLANYLSEEARAAALYQLLAFRVQGGIPAVVCARLQAEAKLFSRKLQTRYFLLTGNCLRLPQVKTPGGTSLDILYALYQSESSGADALAAIAENITNQRISTLFVSMAACKRRRVTALESVIEGLMGSGCCAFR